MNLYIKQKVFSWKDKFDIMDKDGRPVYHAEGEVFTIGKKLHLYDMNGGEVARIEEEILTFLPRYYVYMNGREVAEVKMEFTIFKPKYHVYGPGWEVSGDYFAHEYEVTNDLGKVASISKKWLTWGDTYEMNILSDDNVQLTLAVLIAIDAVMAQQGR